LKRTARHPLLPPLSNNSSISSAADAQQAYLDLVQLGLVAARGGFQVDRFVGTAIANMGIDGLRQLRDELLLDEQHGLRQWYLRRFKGDVAKFFDMVASLSLRWSAKRQSTPALILEGHPAILSSAAQSRACTLPSGSHSVCIDAISSFDK
jgi:hypothetical protein